MIRRRSILLIAEAQLVCVRVRVRGERGALDADMRHH